MKLAMAKPSMTSSSQDTDSRFLRRGGLCLPKPGRHSLLPGPRTLLVPQASRSEPEDMDVARSWARSTLRRRRSLSRCERDRRLCLNPVLRLGPSIIKPPFFSNSGGNKGTLFESQSGFGHRTADEHNHTGPRRSPVKMALMEPVAIIYRPLTTVYWHQCRSFGEIWVSFH